MGRAIWPPIPLQGGVIGGGGNVPPLNLAGTWVTPDPQKANWMGGSMEGGRIKQLLKNIWFLACQSSWCPAKTPIFGAPKSKIICEFFSRIFFYLPTRRLFCTSRTVPGNVTHRERTLWQTNEVRFSWYSNRQKSDMILEFWLDCMVVAVRWNFTHEFRLNFITF